VGTEDLPGAVGQPADQREPQFVGLRDVPFVRPVDVECPDPGGSIRLFS
jgi:hypothetical protein